MEVSAHVKPQCSHRLTFSHILAHHSRTNDKAGKVITGNSRSVQLLYALRGTEGTNQA